MPIENVNETYIIAVGKLNVRTGYKDPNPVIGELYLNEVVDIYEKYDFGPIWGHRVEKAGGGWFCLRDADQKTWYANKVPATPPPPIVAGATTDRVYILLQGLCVHLGYKA